MTQVIFSEARETLRRDLLPTSSPAHALRGIEVLGRELSAIITTQE